MIELPRRKFLIGLASLVATPAVVKASSLMPVRSFKITDYVSDGLITRVDVLYGRLDIDPRWLADFKFFQGAQWNLNDLHSRQ